MCKKLIFFFGFCCAFIPYVLKLPLFLFEASVSSVHQHVFCLAASNVLKRQENDIFTAVRRC